MRKLYIIGDIDHSAYESFTKDLSELEDENHEPVHVVLCSDGGDAAVALAFYERIKMSPCFVSITGTGLVASAAVLILAAGRHRSLTPSAWVMVHDDTPHPDEVKHERIVSLEKKVLHYIRLEGQWNKLLADNTTTSAEEWDELHKKETYLSATEALKLGLIEEVL